MRNTRLDQLRSYLAAKQKRDANGRFASDIGAAHASIDRLDDYKRSVMDENIPDRVANVVKRRFNNEINKRVAKLKQADADAGVQPPAPTSSRFRSVDHFDDEAAAQAKLWNNYLRTKDFKAGDKNRTEASKNIVKEVVSVAKSEPENFRGFFDEAGNLQAAAIITKEKDHLYIDYLASAPWNVSGSDSRRTGGAGSEAIERIVRESVDSGRGGKVKLFSLRDAMPFYEKVGFVRDESRSQKMTLHPDAAQAFLARQEERRRRSSGG